MKFRTDDFQCPGSGTPITANFDDKNGFLKFVVHNDFDEDTDTLEWCERNFTICDDVEEAQKYLSSLGIKGIDAEFY